MDYNINELKKSFLKEQKLRYLQVENSVLQRMEKACDMKKDLDRNNNNSMIGEIYNMLDMQYLEQIDKRLNNIMLIQIFSLNRELKEVDEILKIINDELANLED